MVISEPINKVNLERITNGIFAFTMTLLARDIVTPEQYTKAALISFEQFSLNTISSIIDFVGVFILLAMFWMLFFQMFHRMKTFDYHFLHVHMLALMAIVIIPFSTAFSNLSQERTFADYFFQINYLVLGLILVYLWYYARSKPALLDPALTNAEATFLSHKYLVPPAVALVGILLIMINSEHVDFMIDILYLVPFIIIAIFFKRPSGEPAV
ncbi:MAG: TMEM175 family protein [Methanoregula sp.]|nr:TMEM175 family protein [Methanoregula sp.]